MYLVLFVASFCSVLAAPIQYEMKLLEDSDITIWTAPPSKRYLESDVPPTATGDSVFTSAAKNEYEPIQLLYRVTLPAPIPVTVDLPEVQNVSVRQGRFANGILDSLRESTCTTNQTITQCTVSATAARHNVLWITYYVPVTANAGVFNGTITLTLSTAKVVNVTLQIYDFVIPETRNFINLNTVHPAEVFPTGSVEEKKQALFDHRITPSRPTYPASFEYADSWDTPPSPNNTLKCTGFNSGQSQDAGNTLDDQLAKYLKGEGWNCVGFQMEIGQRYVSDTEHRPASFCGADIGTQNGTATYNQAWGFFLTALSNYVKANGLEGKVAYNIMTNPETAEEIGTAGELCKLAKDKAPDILRIIEEEARADIVSSGCGYDVWITPVDRYDQQYSWSRQQINQEAVWLSPTSNDESYPNPYNATSPGIETRIWGFLSWSSRALGLYWNNTAYNVFTASSGDIKVSFELFREAWEDYEYLFIANGLEQPRPCTRSMADFASFAIARSVSSFVNDDSSLMNVRHALGRFNEDSITDIKSNLEIVSFEPLAINFQDPAGSPTTPIININGAIWTKQGWSARNAQGLGWTGDGLLTPSNLNVVYNNVGDDRMSSALVDLGKKVNSFWYPIPPGIYDVTVACGDPQRLATETMNVVVNNIPVITNYAPSVAEPFQERQVTIEVTDDNGLEFKVGILNQLTYIMYIRIDYSDIIDFRCKSIVAVTDNSGVQPSCKKEGCTNLGFCTTIAPTPAPPTAVPTAVPTLVPIPVTPLPPGSTSEPTSVPPPPTPLPPGESAVPTAVPTIAPTVAPTAVPTAAPPIPTPTPSITLTLPTPTVTTTETLPTPTASETLPTPTASATLPTPTASTTPTSTSTLRTPTTTDFITATLTVILPESDDEFLPTWGWIILAAAVALLLLFCVAVVFCMKRSSSGPPIAPHEFYEPEQIHYESLHMEQQKTSMNTGLRRDATGNGVYYI
eukprot:TRINITY_DN6250_c0_g1_i2.p1 TRINITY_DN6250_c0_g1~~TRINITY_DN6250_c0_g1_i2.p1  ORF type:complete len:968 (+),score=164.92 TRINITY_DN6250_c0_g1_i2:147-3050(+)